MVGRLKVLLWTVIVVASSFITVNGGPWCYDCDKAFKPGSCGEIIKCQDDEQCYASSQTSATGLTQFKAGCMKHPHCNAATSPHGNTSPHQCEECCQGDHCNNQLCGGLPVPRGGPLLCMMCEAVQSLGECDRVEECGVDQYCSILRQFKFGMIFYDQGCIEKRECPEHMQGVDQMGEDGYLCCDNDLCNSDLHTIHTSPNPLTTARPATNAVTTVKPGSLTCRQCKSVKSPKHCNVNTQCGHDQMCAIETEFLFGIQTYHLDCREKSECVNHMVGAHILSETGLLCCDQHLCNSNLQMNPGQVTPLPTTTSTSLGPVTTARLGSLTCKGCHQVKDPSECDQTVECGQDQLCTIEKEVQFGIEIYQLGCKEKTTCTDHMVGDHPLSESGYLCCEGYLCNSNLAMRPVVTTTTVKPSTTPSLSGPEILNNNASVTAIAGKVLVLTCDVRGNPKPDVTWNFEKVSGGRPHNMKINGSTLTIGGLGSEHEGDYRCVATNKLGTKEGIIHLKVTAPLTVTLEPPVVTLAPHMPVLRLKCVADGLPKPTVTWSKLGGPDLSTNHNVHFVHGELLALGIKDINKYVGIYVCNASNGANSTAAYQVVAGKIMQNLGNHVQFQNISTIPGKAYSLTCPPGTTTPDRSAVTTEFDLDRSICTSARQVGLINSGPGSVTWVVRPDGKAEFVNGSLPSSFGQHLKPFPTTIPSPAFGSTSSASIASSSTSSVSFGATSTMSLSKSAAASNMLSASLATSTTPGESVASLSLSESTSANSALASEGPTSMPLSASVTLRIEKSSTALTASSMVPSASFSVLALTNTASMSTVPTALTSAASVVASKHTTSKTAKASTPFAASAKTASMSAVPTTIPLSASMTESPTTPATVSALTNTASMYVGITAMPLASSTASLVAPSASELATTLITVSRNAAFPSAGQTIVPSAASVTASIATSESSPIYSSATPSATESASILNNAATMSRGMTSLSASLSPSTKEASMSASLSSSTKEASMSASLSPSTKEASLSASLSSATTEASMSASLSTLTIKASMSTSLSPSTEEASMSASLSPLPKEASMSASLSSSTKEASMSASLSTLKASMSASLSTSTIKASMPASLSPSTKEASMSASLSSSTMKALLSASLSPSTKETSMSASLSPSTKEVSMSASLSSSTKEASMSASLSTSTIKASMSASVSPSAKQAPMPASLSSSTIKASMSTSLSPSTKEASISASSSPSTKEASMSASLSPSTKETILSASLSPSTKETSMSASLSPSTKEVSMSASLSSSTKEASMSASLSTSTIKASMSASVSPSAKQAPMPASLSSSTIKASMSTSLSPSTKEASISASSSPSTKEASMSASLSPSTKETILSASLSPSTKEASMSASLSSSTKEGSMSASLSTSTIKASLSASVSPSAKQAPMPASLSSSTIKASLSASLSPSTKGASMSASLSPSTKEASMSASLSPSTKEASMSASLSPSTMSASMSEVPTALPLAASGAASIKTSLTATLGVSNTFKSITSSLLLGTPIMSTATTGLLSKSSKVNPSAPQAALSTTILGTVAQVKATTASASPAGGTTQVSLSSSLEKDTALTSTVASFLSSSSSKIQTLSANSAALTLASGMLSASSEASISTYLASPSPAYSFTSQTIPLSSLAQHMLIESSMLSSKPKGTSVGTPSFAASTSALHIESSSIINHIIAPSATVLSVNLALSTRSSFVSSSKALMNTARLSESVDLSKSLSSSQPSSVSFEASTASLTTSQSAGLLMVSPSNSAGPSTAGASALASRGASTSSASTTSSAAAATAVFTMSGKSMTVTKSAGLFFNPSNSAGSSIVAAEVTSTGSSASSSTVSKTAIATSVTSRDLSAGVLTAFVSDTSVSSSLAASSSLATPPASTLSYVQKPSPYIQSGMSHFDSTAGFSSSHLTMSPSLVVHGLSPGSSNLAEVESSSLIPVNTVVSTSMNIQPSKVSSIQQSIVRNSESHAFSSNQHILSLSTSGTTSSTESSSTNTRSLSTVAAFTSLSVKQLNEKSSNHVQASFSSRISQNVFAKESPSASSFHTESHMTRSSSVNIETLRLQSSILSTQTPVASKIIRNTLQSSTASISAGASSNVKSMVPYGNSAHVLPSQVVSSDIDQKSTATDLASSSETTRALSLAGSVTHSSMSVLQSSGSEIAAYQTLSSSQLTISGKYSSQVTHSNLESSINQLDLSTKPMQGFHSTDIASLSTTEFTSAIPPPTNVVASSSTPVFHPSPASTDVITKRSNIQSSDALLQNSPISSLSGNFSSLIPGISLGTSDLTTKSSASYLQTQAPLKSSLNFLPTSSASSFITGISRNQISSYLPSLSSEVNTNAVSGSESSEVVPNMQSIQPSKGPAVSSFFTPSSQTMTASSAPRPYVQSSKATEPQSTDTLIRSSESISTVLLSSISLLTSSTESIVPMPYAHSLMSIVRHSTESLVASSFATDFPLQSSKLAEPKTTEIAINSSPSIVAQPYVKTTNPTKLLSTESLVESFESSTPVPSVQSIESTESHHLDLLVSSSTKSIIPMPYVNSLKLSEPHSTESLITNSIESSVRGSYVQSNAEPYSTEKLVSSVSLVPLPYVKSSKPTEPYSTDALVTSSLESVKPMPYANSLKSTTLHSTDSLFTSSTDRDVKTTTSETVSLSESYSTTPIVFLLSSVPQAQSSGSFTAQTSRLIYTSSTVVQVPYGQSVQPSATQPLSQVDASSMYTSSARGISFSSVSQHPFKGLQTNFMVSSLSKTIVSTNVLITAANSASVKHTNQKIANSLMLSRASESQIQSEVSVYGSNVMSASPSSKSQYHFVPTESILPSPLSASETKSLNVLAQVSNSLSSNIQSSSFALSFTPSSLAASSVPEHTPITTSTTVTRTTTTTTQMTTTTTTPTTTTPGDPPGISIQHKKVSGLYAGNVTLTCNVTGSPNLNITWDYDNSKVFNARENGNTLEIVYVTDENTGKYVCQAENNWGFSKGAIELTVTRPLELHLDSPVVVLDPSAGFALLRCEAGEKSNAKFAWTKYNDDHFLDDPKIVNTGDGELILTYDNTTVQNYAGVYVCHADNGISTGDLIEVAPGLIEEKLDSNTQFQNISVEAGSAFKATCPSGSTKADGTSLTKGVDSTSLICESARKVGVLQSGSGSVVWYIRKDGKAEFVDEQKGLKTLS